MISLALSHDFFKKLKTKFGNKEDGVLVTQALKYAFDNGLEPALIKAKYRDAKNARPYYIAKSTEHKLRQVLDSRLPIDPSANMTSITTGILASVVSESDRRSDKQVQSIHTQWLVNAGLSSRTGQARLITKVASGLKTPNSVVIAEASVGIGKGYASAVTAIERGLELIKMKSDRCVVLTAPTYQLAKQLKNATQVLIDANNLDIGVTMVRSRSEFISSRLLLDYLKDNAAEINEQVAAGCLNLLDKEVYLRTEYEDIGLDCKNLTLSRYSDAEDPAELLYQAERSQNILDKIVICTHAFLAIHASSLRRKASKKLGECESLKTLDFNHACHSIVNSNPELYAENRMLGEIDLLIVDEAHAIFDSYQALRTSRVSLSELKHSIEKVFNKSLRAELIKPVDDFIEAAKNQGDIKGNYPAAITVALTQSLKAIRVKLNSKKNTPQKIRLLETLDELDDFRVQRRHSLYLSPVRGEASIQTGPSNPKDWLQFTWLLASQAVLVSGTLATSALGGSVSYIPFAGRVAIDFTRIHAVDPIESEWIRESVSLFAPKESKNTKELDRFENTAFKAPDHKNHEAFKTWIVHQAAYIAEFVSTGEGGAIIVCTSYAQIEALAPTLKKLLKNVPNIHLMMSEKSRSMVSQVTEYKMAYKSDQRPIWLSITAIGTGVDITDSLAPPINDKMLHTLFITRLPLGFGETNNWNDKISSAVILFKQILGRLVRRQGREGMQVHIMDARATISSGYYNKFRSVVLKYPKIHYIANGK